MSKKEQRSDSHVHDSPEPDKKRRDFLRGSLAAGVAATIAAGSSTASVVENTNGMELKPAADKKEGYRLTEHIADYYKSAAL